MSENTLVRTRIAPSPTGYPHIGTVFQALFDYVYAKQMHGQFIIRIEDTDRGRYVEDAEDAIYHALEWTGLIPDEGPKYGGSFGPYRQSERLTIYKKYAEDLVDSGHAYYCFCSPERLDQVRKDKQASGLPPMYDRHCRNLDPDEAKRRTSTEPHVIRMKIPDNETISFTDRVRGEISFDSNSVDDQVLMKSDGYPTYHLAVVVDDHLMGINFVIRGEEWISSTPKHVLLYRYFGWDLPQFIHTPLLRNPDKSKLSKRHGHSAVSWYIEQGYLPESVINFLASRVWNHPEGKEIFDLNDLIKLFDFDHMHILGPIVDLKKLDWINGIRIRELSDEELIQRLQPYKPIELSAEMLSKFLPLIKERLVKLADIKELTTYLYEEPVVDQKELLKQAKMTPVELQTYFNQVVTSLESISDWTVPSIETTLRGLQEKLALKPRAAFMSIRLALTGSEATPPLFDIIHLLGKHTSTARLKRSLVSA